MWRSGSAGRNERRERHVKNSRSRRWGRAHEQTRRRLTVLFTKRTSCDAAPSKPTRKEKREEGGVKWWGPRGMHGHMRTLLDDPTEKERRKQKESVGCDRVFVACACDEEKHRQQRKRLRIGGECGWWWWVGGEGGEKGHREQTKRQPRKCAVNVNGRDRRRERGARCRATGDSGRETMNGK